MKTPIIIVVVAFLNLVIGVGSSAADTTSELKPSELEIFDNEPPIIKDLLERATVLLGDAENVDSAWKAANL